MTFIQQNKQHIFKVGYTLLGGLIVWAFALGGIIKEHNDMVKDFPGIQSEQRRLSMNDTLMSLKIQQIIDEQKRAADEQRRSNKVLYSIANKLHVEIPVQ